MSRFNEILSRLTVNERWCRFAVERDLLMKTFKELRENFQDGRNPQDKGDMARHGLKGKTITQLKKIRSSETASPRQKQLAHWRINMVQGKNKKR